MSRTEPPRLVVEGVGKRYGSVRALQGIELEVGAGEIHALCGHNGAGKSTLVKIVSGVIQPDEGAVSIDGGPVEFGFPGDAQRAGVSLVDQEISLIPALSVRENLLVGLPGAPMFERRGKATAHVRELLKVVGLADINPNSSVEKLSIGQRQLLEIARALGRGGKLLILDEPTATLSAPEIDRVFAAVRSVAARDVSVLYVSHRLGEVLDLCDRASVFRDGRLVATRDVSDLDKGTLVNLMVGDVPERSRPESTVVYGSLGIDVRVTVPGSLHGLPLSVRSGSIVALAGQVGSGSSEALKALAGLLPEATGEGTVLGRRVRWGSPVGALKSGISYVSNDRKSEGLFLEQTTRTNLMATRLETVSRMGVVRRRRLRTVAASLARLVGLEAKQDTRVRAFSGGNQQKVFLGRCLQKATSGVLLLDEPTRGVDIAGRSEIHDLIRAAASSGNTVLFASTELDEVLDLADQVITLSAGRVVSSRPRNQVDAQTLLAEMTHDQRVPAPA